MTYRENRIGLQVRLTPERAQRAIARALRDAGTEAGAARLLGCGRSSLQRWRRRLEAGGFGAAPEPETPVETEPGDGG